MQLLPNMICTILDGIGELRIARRIICISDILLHFVRFSIINFSSSPMPAANRSIEISSPRLHYGRAAFYGSTIVPLLHRRVMQVPPAYQCSCSCQASRRIAALQQRDVPDWAVCNFQGAGHGDAFTTKEPWRTPKSDTLENFSEKRTPMDRLRPMGERL